MLKKIGFILALVIGSSALLKAQEVNIEGRFQTDSVKIGVPIPYTLKAEYPREWNVIFPDSLFNFSPFEYERKDYFTTRSNDSISVDSVVYYLSTFEIDSIQFLRLPVFQVRKKDSIRHYTELDTVLLIELIETLPDSIQLKENTAYLNVPTEFNYPYFIIGLSILVIVVIAIIIIFGGRIRKAWQIRQLNKRYQKFVLKFDEAVAIAKLQETINAISNIVSVWKKYLEKLERAPYTKLTTKELHSLFDNNQELLGTLQAIDSWIYGGRKSDKIPFEMLKDFAAERLHERKEEVKNG